MFKLKKIQVTASLLTVIAFSTFGSELTRIEFSRTSYAISYSNSDSIKILCSDVNSCIVSAIVNGKTFSITAADLKVKRIDPYHAILRTRGDDKEHRETDFSIDIATSCKDTEKVKYAACFTYAEIVDGKVTMAYTEARRDED